MAIPVEILSIEVEKEVQHFIDNIPLSISLQLNRKLEKNLHWKVIYIGCPNDPQYDQILEQFELEPQNLEGTVQFQINCEPPNPQLIPTINDLLGITAIIISAGYNGKEFFRCGFYINNYLPSIFQIDEQQTLEISNIERNILANKPRITKFSIDWNNSNSVNEDVYVKKEQENLSLHSTFIDQDEQNQQQRRINFKQKQSRFETTFENFDQLFSTDSNQSQLSSFQQYDLKNQFVN